MLNVEGLVNREFAWGYHDCYGLASDFYRQNFGLELTNYARPTNWQSDTNNLIDNLYEREGFEKISTWKLKDMRPGDALAMAILESNPNHIAIYIGDNQFIHHLYGRFSTVEPMAAYWIHATCFLLRHPDVPDLRPKLGSIALEDLLLARHQN